MAHHVQFSLMLHVTIILLEGPVISAHSVQVARFLFIDSHMSKGRGTPPRIVEPLNFAPLCYSLNICLHRR